MSSKKQPRDQVSARLDPEVLEVVQHVADAERRPNTPATAPMAANPENRRRRVKRGISGSVSAG